MGLISSCVTKLMKRYALNINWVARLKHNLPNAISRSTLIVNSVQENAIYGAFKTQSAKRNFAFNVSCK